MGRVPATTIFVVALLLGTRLCAALVSGKTIDYIAINRYEECHDGTPGMSATTLTCHVGAKDPSVPVSLEWHHNGHVITSRVKSHIYIRGSFNDDLIISKATTADTGVYSAIITGTNVIACDISLRVMPENTSCSYPPPGMQPTVILASAPQKQELVVEGVETCVPSLPESVSSYYLSRTYNITITTFREQKVIRLKVPGTNSSKLCYRAGDISPTEYVEVVTVDDQANCPLAFPCVYIWNSKYLVSTINRASILDVTSNVSVPIGQAFTYTCTGTGYNPQMRLIDEFGNLIEGTGGRHFNVVTTTGRLTTHLLANSTVASISISGAFSPAWHTDVLCVVENTAHSDLHIDYSRPENEDRRLTVLKPIRKPVIDIVRKESLCNGTLLQCVAYGDPAPNQTWLFNGQLMANASDPFLMVFDESGKKGTYTCVGVNLRGVARQSVVVNGTNCPDHPDSVSGLNVNIIIILVSAAIIGITFVVVIICLQRARAGRNNSKDDTESTSNTNISASSMDGLSGRTTRSNAMDSLADMIGVPNDKKIPLPADIALIPEHASPENSNYNDASTHTSVPVIS
ncbi:uncharacterized protein LOC135809217 [Sycon ciliatum]|uniref:uncharacterized protein LOC135809217 n=1 Tax=Sycon ciliatum TaxID=27933 RepID=UPI0031F6367B